jgi:hypothetical protein
MASPSDSYKLVNANDIVLRFITEGSLDLPQDFKIFDYDTEPTQNRYQNSASFEANVVIQFTAAADGSIDYSQFSVLSSNPSLPGSFVPLYYESADCTGQGYLNRTGLGVDGTVYKLDGEWVRLPLRDYEATNVGIIAKSKTNPTPFATDPCEVTNELVTLAVIPIAYDPEPIRLKLSAPVRIVEP